MFYLEFYNKKLEKKITFPIFISLYKGSNGEFNSNYLRSGKKISHD